MLHRECKAGELKQVPGTAWLEKPARCPIPWQFGTLSIALHIAVLGLLPAAAIHRSDPPVLNIELARQESAQAVRPIEKPLPEPRPLPALAPLQKPQQTRAASPQPKAAPAPAPSSALPPSPGPAPAAAAPALPVGAGRSGTEQVPAGVPGGSPAGLPAGVPGGEPKGVPGGVPGGLPGGNGSNENKPAPLTPPASRPEPRPVPAGPSEQEIKQLGDEYKAGVRSAILANKSYPEMARRLEHSGSVKLSIRINSDGSLESVSVSSSSGYDELDEAAVQAVRDAAPFESFPDGLNKASISFGYSLKFRLSN